MKIKSQFLKFCLVGTLNTFIHYLTFLFLYKIIYFPILIASTTGYLLGVVNSFLVNRSWTFEIVGKAEKKEFMKFVIVNIFSLGTNLGLLTLSINVLHLLPEIAQVIAILFSLIVNYFGNKFWTFGMHL